MIVDMSMTVDIGILCQAIFSYHFSDLYQESLGHVQKENKKPIQASSQRWSHVTYGED